MKKTIGFAPRVRVEGGDRGVVSPAGAVLLVGTVRKRGLDTAISAAPAPVPWRRPRAVHDPGKILLDVALAVVLGRNWTGWKNSWSSSWTKYGPSGTNSRSPSGSWRG